MKRLLPIFLAASLCAVAGAQDLDTLNFTDQLNSGDRGNNTGSGTYGASNPDGTEFQDYSGPDLSGTATFVRYINTWATNGDPESPVLNVTEAHNNPDRGNALPILPANTRPGAANPETAVFVGDDGGFNALWFGEPDDTNYYATVDVYCPVFTPSDPVAVEYMGLAVRGGRNDDGDANNGDEVYDFSYSPDRDGSYALIYDSQRKTIRALKWTVGNSAAVIETRDTAAYTEFATQAIEDNGWHTFQIVANGDSIKFVVDGTELITVTDTEFTNGRAAVYYREEGLGDAAEFQGVFDQLRAGPASEANVVDWTMY